MGRYLGAPPSLLRAISSLPKAEEPPCAAWPSSSIAQVKQPQTSERMQVRRLDIGVGEKWASTLCSGESQEIPKFWEIVGGESANSVRGRREREFCSWAANARILFVGAPN
jgi:hypothetical protein